MCRAFAAYGLHTVYRVQVGSFVERILNEFCVFVSGFMWAGGLRV